MKAKSVLLVLACLLQASLARGQNQPLAVDSCVAAIPASALKRVPVFLQATADLPATGILGEGDLFAQSVGFKLREMLGGSELKMPEADSVLAWPLLWGELVVTAHRNGPVTWRVPAWSTEADASPRSSLRLLQTAVKAVVASGETVMLPEGFTGDSLSFSLSLANPQVTKAGKIVPVKLRQSTPVFTIAVAWTKPVEQTRQPDIAYPPASASARMVGRVRMLFPVEKSGRANTDSATAIWPSGAEPLTGDLLDFYNAFARAVKYGLASARYSPAVIGGCVVRSTVFQTFEFQFR